MHPCLAAATTAVLLLTATAASAAVPDVLTPEDAARLAAARPDLAAMRARVMVAAADSVAARTRPPLGWSLAHHRAGEGWGGGDEHSTELEFERSLDPWRRRAAAAAAAGSEREAAQRADAAVRTERALAARHALLRAWRLERHAAVLDSLAEAERRFEAAVRARVADGGSTPLEGRLAGLERAALESRLAAAQRDARIARLALAQAVGVDDAEWAARVGLRAVVVPDTQWTPAQVRAAALAAPSVRRTEGELGVARARTRFAAGAGRPELSVAAAASLGGSRIGRDALEGDPGGLTGISDEERGLVLRVSGTLPDRAGAAAARARAAAAEQAAVAEVAAVRLAAGTEALVAHAEHLAAAREALAWAPRAAQARADLARVEAALADGRITLTDALAIRRALAEAVRMALDAEAQHIEARAALERACGMTLDDLLRQGR